MGCARPPPGGARSGGGRNAPLRDLDAGVGEEAQLLGDRVLPDDHLRVEVGPVPFLARVLNFVERSVFCVEELTVPEKEMVVDRLVHSSPPIVSGPPVTGR